jgi:hypothetical protein
MRALSVSLIIIGLSFVSAAPAIAENDVPMQNQSAIAYPMISTDQVAVTPVARYYTYYGGPGWYTERYYPRYRAYYNGYPVRPYPYRTYVVPGPVYGYSNYAPFDFYYSGPRVRFGFGF